MATKKVKKVVLPNRYDAEHRGNLDRVKNNAIMKAEGLFGIGEIAKSRYGFLGRKKMERMFGMLIDEFHLDEEIEGLGHYHAVLNWFAVEKDKDNDPLIAVKINVSAKRDCDGCKAEKTCKKGCTWDNTFPYVYDTLWSGNLLDAIGDILDKLDSALAAAENTDYSKLPKNMQG